MKVVLREVFCILTLVLSHSHSVTNQQIVVLVTLRMKKGNWKALPAGSRGLELIQRLQSRVTGHSEYWGESLPESVQVIEENKR